MEEERKGPGPDRIGVVAVLVADLTRRWHAAQARAVLESVSGDCDALAVYATVRTAAEKAELEADPARLGPVGTRVRVVVRPAPPSGVAQWEALLASAQRVAREERRAAWVVLPCTLRFCYARGQRAPAARAALASLMQAGVGPARQVWRCCAYEVVPFVADCGGLLDESDPAALARTVLTADMVPAHATRTHSDASLFALSLVALQLMVLGASSAETLQRGLCCLPTSRMLPDPDPDPGSGSGSGSGLVPAAEAWRREWHSGLGVDEITRIVHSVRLVRQRSVPCEWLVGVSVDDALRRRGAVLGVRVAGLGQARLLRVALVLATNVEAAHELSASLPNTELAELTDIRGGGTEAFALGWALCDGEACARFAVVPSVTVAAPVPVPVPVPGIAPVSVAGTPPRGEESTTISAVLAPMVPVGQCWRQRARSSTSLGAGNPERVAVHWPDQSATPCVLVPAQDGPSSESF